MLTSGLSGQGRRRCPPALPKAFTIDVHPDLGAECFALPRIYALLSKWIGLRLLSVQAPWGGRGGVSLGEPHHRAARPAVPGIEQTVNLPKVVSV